MDFNRFVLERRPVWKRFQMILDRIDSAGLGSLDPQEAEEFYTLYRHVSSDLNLVQTRSGAPALLEFLEGLVSRAYAYLAAPKLKNPFKAYWNVIRHKFPAVVREEWRLLAIATAFFVMGSVFGFAATMLDPKAALVLLPHEHSDISPKERVQNLEEMESEGKTRIDDAGTHAAFTTFLFTHNIRVTALAFAVGLTFGVGTLILLFYNGVILGSLAYMYLADGVIVFFIAWIGPHGSIELPCIWLGATAGLMMARAQYRRDLGPLWSQIRAMRQKLIHIFIGAATLLVLAGIVEGGFSQVNEPTLPYPVKIFTACLLFAFLLIYLFKIPVKTTFDE